MSQSSACGAHRRRGNRVLSFGGWGLILLLFLASAGRAETEESDPYRSLEGPIEERNQFLFNLLFLAFPARSAELVPAGEQQILFSQSYANTFVGTKVFFSLAQDDPSGNRQHLTPGLVNDARQAEPESILYFVDSAQGRTELRYRVGVSRWFEAGIEIPFLSYRGGTLDRLIESYHDTLNLGNGGREVFVRDETQILLSTKEGTVFIDSSPSRFELGDVSLFGRFGLHRGERGSLALSLALKWPTGDEELLAGSGRADMGVEVLSTSRWGPHRLHLAGGWVRVGNWALLPGYDPDSLASARVGYEFVWRDSVSWIAQLQSQSTVFRNRAEDRLGDPANEFVAGVRWSQRGRWFWEAAFIENIFNQDTGVDIGFRIGGGIRLPSR